MFPFKNICASYQDIVFCNNSHLPAIRPAIIIPAAFYLSQIGFFCKQEIKMDKAIKIPFRFRLGSIASCDWLEGKQRAD
ncbi:MAG: hypothetical protein HY305_06730 [Sphingobacteriales bacterium]|nr:hypothetical protein [Sphingobacteriales bacterium]